MVAGNPYQPEVVSAVLSSTDHPGSVITGNYYIKLLSLDVLG